MNARLLIGLAALSALVAPAAAEARDRIQFEVAAQPLETALFEFAAQARISLAIPANGISHATTAGLSGAHDVDQGLALLLRGSGYRFEHTGPAAYRIILQTVTAVAAPPTPVSSSTSDIIVVTARRPTALGSLPRAMTHFDAQRLAEAGVDDDDALTKEVGGLSFTNVGEGRNKVILRGVSDGALTARAQSLVGIYFADTRITYAAPDPDLKLIDIASVDVLRGPQGALYGAGAIGGIMRIEPNQADLSVFSGEASLAAEATQGGGMGRDVSLVVNAPLLRGLLGARAALYDQSIAGWQDNATRGARDANEVRRRGARTTLLAQLAPDWTVRVSAAMQMIDSKDSQYLALTPTGVRRQAAVAEPHDNDFSLVAATLNGRTRWGDLTSTTSYVGHELQSRYDTTGAFASLGISPGATSYVDESDALSVMTHETRLASPSGSRVDWFGGFFFADGDNSRDVVLRDSATGDAADYTEHRVDNIDEFALFGDVTWRLTPAVSLSTGLRIFESRVATRSITNLRSAASQDSFSGSLTESGAAPDFRLSYQPTRQVLLFISAAEGYRSGGFNTGGVPGMPYATAIQPFRRYTGDEIWTYEAGMRLGLLDGRLDLAATAFANDWRDVQTDSLFANGFTYSGNVGQARAIGLEFDARYAPIANMELRAHGLINEPEVSEVVASLPQATRGGLPGAPEYLGSASARYTHTMSGDARAFLELGAQYTSASTSGFGRGSSIGNFAIFNARLGFDSGPWSAAIAAENMTNSDGATFSIGNPYRIDQTYVTPPRPRTFRLSLSRSF